MKGVFPEPLTQAIKALALLPGWGEKSATRLALYLVRRPERAEQLASALRALSRIKLCRECGNFTEIELCNLCADPDRDDSVIGVLEDPASLSASRPLGSLTVATMCSTGCSLPGMVSVQRNSESRSSLNA